jgi:hypothetical protein
VVEAVSLRRRRGLVHGMVLLAAFACVACTKDEPHTGDSDSEAGSGGGMQSGGSGVGGARAGGPGVGGSAGSSAPTGSAGGSGSGSPRAGTSGGAGSGVDPSSGGEGGAGSDPAGAGGNDGGNAGSGSGGSGTAGAGGSGTGFPTDLEGSCTTDADCELCTAPLGIDDDCCPGCPIVTSKEICAQLAAAFEACGPSVRLCPIPSCLFPGSPACGTEGKCVMGDGIQQ